MIISSMRYPFSLMLGVVFGLMLIFFSPMLMEAGAELYDGIHPIATDWTVTESHVDGNDVIVSGTMVKHRNCIFVPPTVARDSTGQNFEVVSKSPTAGKTWGASDEPQRFGPWRVVGGAGKQLKFVNVYLCGEGRPAVLELGAFGSGR